MPRCEALLRTLVFREWDNVLKDNTNSAFHVDNCWVVEISSWPFIVPEWVRLRGGSKAEDDICGIDCTCSYCRTFTRLRPAPFHHPCIRTLKRSRLEHLRCNAARRSESYVAVRGRPGNISAGGCVNWLANHRYRDNLSGIGKSHREYIWPWHPADVC